MRSTKNFSLWAICFCALFILPIKSRADPLVVGYDINGLSLQAGDQGVIYFTPTDHVIDISGTDLKLKWSNWKGPISLIATKDTDVLVLGIQAHLPAGCRLDVILESNPNPHFKFHAPGGKLAALAPEARSYADQAKQRKALVLKMATALPSDMPTPLAVPVPPANPPITPPVDASVPAPTNPVAYPLSYNDQITVTVSGLGQDARVDFDGRIPLLPLGRVKVAGCSERTASILLTQLYSEKLGQPSNVSVTVSPDHAAVVEVTGSVLNPDLYTVPQGRDTVPLAHLLEAAGGITGGGSQRSISWHHAGNLRQLQLPADANTAISPGDAIMVGDGVP